MRLHLIFFVTALAVAGADVFELLEAKCYECHSHASGKMKGGLTLDSRAGWATGGDNGPAIVPGDAEKSLLIDAIRRLDEDLAMPPKKPLTGAEIKVFVDWVNAGAEDSRGGEAAAKAERPDTDWWSLRPLARREPPAAGHPIDSFLEKRLKAAGLEPSPPADRRTQLRRLSYNLHGLPPTPEDVAAFEADMAPDAYARRVDELLASPRYGERWARHWLDTVHYADSHGCEHDRERPHAWRYRDYVIKRLNADIAWPRFIREQLAADLLFPDEAPLEAALGFVGAGPLELSRKGTAPVTFAYLDRDSIVTQTMGAFASTTVNCARCHDHKFDPVSKEDYYALQAVFAGVDKGVRKFDHKQATADARQRWAALLRAANTRDAAILLAPGQQKTSDSYWARRDQTVASWTPLKPGVFLSEGGADLTLLDDDSILAGGKSPVKERYTVTADIPLSTIAGLRLDVLPHDTLPLKGPGRADNGNFHLHEIECQVFEAGTSKGRKIELRSATADYSQAAPWTIEKSIDGDPKTAWAIHPKVGMAHYAVFTFKERLTLKPGSRLVVVLNQPFGAAHVIGRFRLSVSDSPAETLEVMPPDVIAALKTPAAHRDEAQQLALAAYAIQQRATQATAALPEPVPVFAVTSGTLRTVHVLSRGNIDKPGAEAQAGAIAAVPGLEGRFTLANASNEASRRAALADWLAHRKNPLTWRSIVNRVWHYHFGRGICDTPNDLGRMGGKPSHPELLDWLAVWFRDEAKGSLKQLHRLIVTSRAYRQESTGRKQAAQVDADNRLLWRMNRLRLDAGQYRDAVRQVSGRLDLTMGGPGIKQFQQQKGVHDSPKLDYDAYDWKRDDARRRSIYRVVWRGNPDPFMEAMDFPNLGLLAPKRSRTISPLQSLVLYNHSFVLHHSDAMADELQGAPQVTVTGEHVVDAFARLYQRTPQPDEQARMLTYAREHGLNALCRVLFNSSEFLYVE